MKHSQRGSAIIYILIAIVLLAALTYNFTKSSRTSGASLSAEQASLAASEIIEYADLVARTVQKLMLRGCSDTEISFEGAESQNAADYVNAGSPTDNSCHVFNVNGGNINYQKPISSARIPDPVGPRDYECNGATFYYRECDNYYFTGHGSAPGVGTDGGASSNRELLMYFTNISEQICSAINEKLGINGIPTDSSGTVWGQGRTFGSTSYGNFNQIDSTDLTGKTAGCVYDSTNPDYSFYQVLIAR